MTVTIDRFFRPSQSLDPYLYGVFLEFASIKELEDDLLFLDTNWQIAKHFDNFCEEYDVLFDDKIAINKAPKYILPKEPLTTSREIKEVVQYTPKQYYRGTSSMWIDNEFPSLYKG